MFSFKNIQHKLSNLKFTISHESKWHYSPTMPQGMCIVILIFVVTEEKLQIPDAVQPLQQGCWKCSISKETPTQGMTT